MTLREIFEKTNVAKDELLNHFHCSELELANNSEIRAGRRLEK